MNDYLNSLEPYKDIREISDLIDEVKKLREYYYTQQYDKMQEHINKLMLKYLAETITWNAIHPIKPITHQESYINAEVFLRAKGIHILLDKGLKRRDQLTSEELALIESSISPTE